VNLYDAIGAIQQDWPVRHHDSGDSHGLERIGDAFLRARIEIGRPLVEEQDAGPPVKRPGQKDPLLLPA
jgi:hypothetical protein